VQWYTLKEMEDADFEDWDKDPYPPFPETLPKGTPLARPAITPSAAADGLCSPSSESRSSTQASVPAPSAPEIVTVDDTTSSRLLEIGIVVGRARPHCCRDPNVRPIVRAILNSKGSVYVYMPHKYAKRAGTKGDVQIATKDIEFSKEFAAAISDEQRLMAIRHQLQAKLALKWQSSVLELIHPSTYKRKRPHRHKTAEDECSIIGRAKPGVCRDPKNPPLVRARVDAKNAVIPFIPGNESLRPHASDRTTISFENVEWLEHFASMPTASRSKVIREMIAGKVEEKKKAEGQQEEEGKHHEARDDEELLVDLDSV
jgi:hypothetical protein